MVAAFFKVSDFNLVLSELFLMSCTGSDAPESGYERKTYLIKSYAPKCLGA
jgi:hypothetical protein